jgi:hypothetical protein
MRFDSAIYLRYILNRIENKSKNVMSETRFCDIKKTFFKEVPLTEKVFPSEKVTCIKNFNVCSFHLNFCT